MVRCVHFVDEWTNCLAPSVAMSSMKLILIMCIELGHALQGLAGDRNIPLLSIGMIVGVTVHHVLTEIPDCYDVDHPSAHMMIGLPSSQWICALIGKLKPYILRDFSLTYKVKLWWTILNPLQDCSCP